MYHSFLQLIIVASLDLLPLAHAIPSYRANPPPIPPLNGSTTTLPSQSLNFLGVSCYHLDPTHDRVSLITCQPLFAALVGGGHIYDEYEFPNGWRFDVPGENCAIRLTSPSREDRRVKMSMSDFIEYGSEVLRECVMGGANTFQGRWQVVVTKKVEYGGVVRGVDAE